MYFGAIVYAIIILLFMALGMILFFSDSYLINSTKRQRSLGRDLIARYQESKFYYYFIKTLGLLLMFGCGRLLYLFVEVLMHGSSK